METSRWQMATETADGMILSDDTFLLDSYVRRQLQAALQKDITVVDNWQQFSTFQKYSTLITWKYCQIFLNVPSTNVHLSSFRLHNKTRIIQLMVKFLHKNNDAKWNKAVLRSGYLQGM